jgi:spore coat protein CotH
MSFFSESELESFYNNQEIDIVATNDLILDMVFSSSFTGQYSDYYLYFNGNTMDFIDSQDDLIWGDLPRNDKEIILALAKNTDINFSCKR